MITFKSKIYIQSFKRIYYVNFLKFNLQYKEYLENYSVTQKVRHSTMHSSYSCFFNTIQNFNSN